MIKTINRLPDVYSEKSRDFQLISRLFDLSFNSSKLAIDTMLNNGGSEDIDYRFIDLACRTIGFEYNGSYDTKELIRKKGTIDSINDAIRLLLNSQGIDSDYYLQLQTDGSGKQSKYLIISLPENIKHTRLLDEIFEYILPAGWQYSILLKNIVEFDSGNTSQRLIINHNIRSKELTDVKTDISNYLKSDGSMEDLTYIGQVPVNTEDKFLGPTVNFETVISTPERAEEE